MRVATAQRRGHGPAAPFLAVVIVAGSVVLWLGIPAAWLWLVAHLSAEYPTIFALALLGCPLSMAAFGVVLGRANAAYLRATGSHPADDRAAWLTSLSGERRPRRPRTLLDTSMTVSVLAALIAMAIWFFLYATSYGPPLGH